MPPSGHKNGDSRRFRARPMRAANDQQGARVAAAALADA